MSARARGTAVFRVLVQRSVDEVKTEYSQDRVPLDENLANVLLEWKTRSWLMQDDWVFANPATGKPYHQEEILKNHIKPAAIAAGIGPEIGWHTFRHMYRSFLGETGAPMKVQQQLMQQELPKLDSFVAQFTLNDEGELIATLLDKNTISDLHQHEYPLLHAAHAQSYVDFDDSETDSKTDPVLYDSKASIHAREWDKRDKDIVQFAVQQERLRFAN